MEGRGGLRPQRPVFNSPRQSPVNLASENLGCRVTPTKLRQLVADQFGLPAEAVVVLPTSTDKNNNTSPTAASASTDLNGAAAVKAYLEYIEREARRR